MKNTRINKRASFEGFNECYFPELGKHSTTRTQQLPTAKLVINNRAKWTVGISFSRKTEDIVLDGFG